MNKNTKRTTETVADFKTRLAMQRRAAEGRPVSILGAAHAHPCVVREKLGGGVERVSVTLPCRNGLTKKEIEETGREVRAQAQLDRRNKVKIETVGGVKVFDFDNGTFSAMPTSEDTVYVNGEILPNAAARALGFYLLRHVRSRYQ